MSLVQAMAVDDGSLSPTTLDLIFGTGPVAGNTLLILTKNYDSWNAITGVNLLLTGPTLGPAMTLAAGPYDDGGSSYFLRAHIYQGLPSSVIGVRVTGSGGLVCQIYGVEEDQISTGGFDGGFSPLANGGAATFSSAAKTTTATGDVLYGVGHGSAGTGGVSPLVTSTSSLAWVNCTGTGITSGYHTYAPSVVIVARIAPGVIVTNATYNGTNSFGNVGGAVFALKTAAQVTPPVGGATLSPVQAQNIYGQIVVPHTAKPRNRIIVPRNYGRIIPVRKLPPDLHV